MPTGRTNLYERYELGEVLGRGGMGVVYRAYDRLMQREVALKTLLDIDNPLTLDLFYKECGLLAAMVHPNIVNVYDVGEFEDNGVTKPFFVMPLLPGATLDHIIRDPRYGLTVERVIEIVSQAGRGLQAAHEMGLVHRDVKPSNIFVMDDYSVKIIDFGIARAASLASMTVLKGTLSYMAPEQLNHKPPTPLSDQYSLAVVCYEALAARRPFQGSTETDLADAIMRATPPPVSDVNPNVHYTVSQVIRKAMARQPELRFPSMRDFTDALHRAARGELLPELDAGKIVPRLERAQAAFDQGDFEFAGELLSQLESEGFLNDEITLLRRRLDQAATRTRVRQLLDSANRYAQAEEFPLALRKINDALELDAQNADALLMKDRLEKVRRDRKFDEWLQLARAQAESLSFHQARESLTNALKIRPNDPEALRMMAECARQEQDLSQSRGQKAALYESAVQSWERGDIGSALGRLESLMEMERNHPDAGTGRDTAYQNFYQQVRAEHDAMQSSYADARRRLDAGDFDGAAGLCRQALARYPNNPLFQALQMDAETGKARRAEAPPQTNDSGSQDRQGLIQSVFDKARFFEERKRFAEAYDQLQIVKAIQPDHPAIDAEVERIRQLRDGQARDALRTRYTGYIDSSIQSGDYDRAQRTIDEALREFPGDAGFDAMRERLRQSRERTANALAMLDQARQQAEASGPEGGFRYLRDAYELDSGNPVVRSVATSMFLDYARTLLQQSPDAAERVLREALKIEPEQADAQAMLREIVENQRQEFVQWCVGQARRLRAEGDIPGALALARQGLATYPDDLTLQQLEAVLAGKPVPQAQPTPPQPVAPPDLVAHSIDDTSVFAAAPSSQPAFATSSPASGASSPTMPPPPPPPGAGSLLPPEFPPSSGEATGVSVPLIPKPVPAPGSKKLWIAGGIAAFIVIALVAGAVEFMRLRKKPKPIVTGAVKVALAATPSGATILIDGSQCGTGTCDVSLAPGEHRAEARLDGYAPAANSFTIPANAQGSIPPLLLSLTPQLPAAVITTNLGQATVTLDQGAQQPVQNGELQLPNLAAGQRSIRFNGEGAQGVLAVTVGPAAAPRLDGPIQQQNLEATAVSAMGGSAKVFTTLAKADVAVDGKPAGKTDPKGVDLNNLAAGAHELVVTAQNASHRLNFTTGGAPVLSVFFGVERNQGVLRVSTGESDAAVFVNGVKFRRPTRDGRLMLYLEPKTYKIRVEKEGFQPVPEQTVEVKRGAEARADFVLVPNPQTGIVLVSHAPAGADVTMDGAPAGKVHTDGILSIPDVKPGNHTIVIKKDAFKPSTREVSVVAGRQAEVDGTLQAAAGTIRITVAPPEVLATATLSWRREGEEVNQPVTANPLPLPEGSYTIIGHAPDHEEARATAKVTAGQTVNAVLVFKRIVVEKKEPVRPRSIGVEELEKAGGWTRENGSLTRIGGNIAILQAAGNSGSYSFQALMTKGKRLEWVVNYTDAKNYVGYELNDDHLDRYELVDGRKLNTAKPKIRVKLDQWIQVTMDVSSTAISLTIRQDAASLSDKIARDGPSLTPGQSFVRGRFGFRVPGKDKLVVGTFAFTPK